MYGDPNQPFTLTQINNPSSNISLNTLSVGYNDLDKVRFISEMGSNKQMDFEYGINKERIKVDYKIGGTSQYTRYYGEGYDRQENANSYKEWTYITAPSGLCAMYYNNNGTTELNYVLNDHLGSPILLTGPGQQVLEEYSFDSWGRRRDPNNWSYTNIPASTKMIRGYTLHEMVDEFALINMNGRVYDPVLGRFIQADDRVTDADNIQTYNIYAYCKNNPLKYIDPSGHEYVPGTQDAIDDQIMYASQAVYLAEAQGYLPYSGGLIQAYPLYGNDLIKFNADWQVINNTRISEIGKAYALPSGGIDFGPDLLTSESISKGMLQIAQSALDGVGLVPGFGEFADGANAAIYAYNGDYWNAGLSLGATVPFAGWAATAGKWADRGYTTLYRAVSPAELSDIAEYGLRNTSGMYESGKLFAPTFEEATKFGKGNYGFDGIPNTIMEVKVPNSIMNNSYKFGADGMNAVSIPAQYLPYIQAKPMTYSSYIR